MQDFSFVIIITLAIAIGFYLGRRSLRKKQSSEFNPQASKSYFQGLNFLLNEQPDKAVDAFVDSLDVNKNTLETHLALGKLMRKQGQVDRAIRIHQNLLARPLLDNTQQHHIHLELGRDFMAAGLLDRAEMLLKEVISESAELRSTAQRFLIEIYQDEGEWQQAIVIGEALLGSRFFKSTDNKRLSMIKMIAHFHCELAEEDRLKGDHLGYKKKLEQALTIDKSSLRASLLLSRLYNQAGTYKSALKVLNKAIIDNPDFITELLPDLLNTYEGVYQDKGFERFLHEIDNKLADKMQVQGLLFAVDQQLARADQYSQSFAVASDMLVKYLHYHPSLIGLNKLINLRLPSLNGEVANEVRNLHDVLKDLLEKRLNYRCGHCGFSGRQLHWRCPGCKKWDQMSSLKNGEFD
tara:strand:- start:447 stop:1670 length:1224 start_codon:yes stop_codon:yes gene_type:complete